MIKNEIGAYHTYSKEHIIGITENRTAHINIKAQDNKKALKIEFANGIFDISDPDVPEKITIHSEDFNIVINTKDFAAFGANEYTVFEILSSANDGEKNAFDFRIYKGILSKEAYYGDINGIYITLKNSSASSPALCKIKAANDINTEFTAKAYLSGGYICFKAQTSALYFYEDIFDVSSLNNISNNKMYTYSYPGAYTTDKDGRKICGFAGDNSGLCLTSSEDFVSFTPHNNISLCGDQYSRLNDIGIFDDKPSYYFIRQDLGFICSAGYLDLKFKLDDNNTMPYKIDLYSSNDGVNFTAFCGEMNINFFDGNNLAYFYEFETPVKAKSFKIVIYSEVKTQNSFSSLNVYGCEKYEYKLLKAVGGGHSYENYQTVLPESKRPDNDEHYYREIIDLDEIKNISELVLSALVINGEDNLQRIETEYSDDGINFIDFGISYKQNSFNYKNLPESVVTQYKIFREFTVKARYINVRAFSEKPFNLSNIKIYGAENEIAAPEFTPAFEYAPCNTNIALGKQVRISGKYDTPNLTSGQISADQSIDLITENSSAHLVLNLGKKANICGFCLQTDRTSYDRISTVNISLSDDGKNYKTTDAVRDDAEYGTYKLIRAGFDKTSAQYIKIEIITSKAADLLTFYELQAYEKHIHLPIITGGFICHYKNSESFNYAHHHRFDDYTIYQTLKGYKEQGMNTIIFSGEALDYINKLSMLSNIPDELRERGYKSGFGMGTEDPCESTLKAADKLGLNVLAGTALAYGWWAVPGTKIFDESTEALEIRRKYFEDVAHDAELIIPYMYEKYRKYKSFKGFYLCDETCDRWMSENSGEASNVYRMIYKRQSDVIRALDPDLKIGIAPAIWRESTPELFYRNLKTMLKAENESKRPVVDFVAFQDCLGRLFEFKIPDKIYDDFEIYLSYAKKALDEIGIEFWNDLEVFDITYRSREYKDIIRAVDLESKYTRNNIVFDLPHYFSSYCKNKFDDAGFVNTDYINFSYVKHISKYINQINQ